MHVSSRISLPTILLGAALAFGPTAARAATIYLTPAEGTVQPGDYTTVEVRVNPDGQCVNAMEVELTYDPQAVQVTDVSVGESILPLWVEAPRVDRDAGRITFIGGIPGGYCGRIPGDPAVTNILARIVFQVPGLRIGQSAIDRFAISVAEGSRVLLNDGQGTAAPLTREGASFAIVDKGAPNQNAWYEEVRRDTVPPEPFTIGFSQDPSLFDGKAVITFSTTDKQTGVARYEVLEADSLGNVPGTMRKAAWVEVASPFILTDQELHSLITVRAIDKAGNERRVEYTPIGYTAYAGPVRDETESVSGRLVLSIVIGLLVVVGLGIAIRRIVRRRRAGPYLPPAPPAS